MRLLAQPVNIRSSQLSSLLLGKEWALLILLTIYPLSQTYTTRCTMKNMGDKDQ